MTVGGMIQKILGKIKINVKTEAKTGKQSLILRLLESSKNISLKNAKGKTINPCNTLKIYAKTMIKTNLD